MPEQVAEHAVSTMGAILTFLSGGLFVKVVELGTQFGRDHLTRRQTEKTFINDHLGPLLKEADEVCGKLRAEADRDFKGLVAQIDGLVPIETVGFAYLIARLWGRIELFRRASLNTVIGKDQRGKKLQQLLNCMESQRVRLVPRLAQRAIGELMISKEKDGYEILPFIEFAEKYHADTQFQEWLAPLITKLRNLQDKSTRQRILLYGIVIHVMIDVLDPLHEITHERPGYANKLSKKTYRDANHRIFEIYLTFVGNRSRYIGTRR